MGGEGEAAFLPGCWQGREESLTKSASRHSQVAAGTTCGTKKRYEMLEHTARKSLWKFYRDLPKSETQLVHRSFAGEKIYGSLRQFLVTACCNSEAAITELNTFSFIGRLMHLIV